MNQSPIESVMEKLQFINNLKSNRIFRIDAFYCALNILWERRFQITLNVFCSTLYTLLHCIKNKNKIKNGYSFVFVVRNEKCMKTAMNIRVFCVVLATETQSRDKFQEMRSFPTIRDYRRTRLINPCMWLLISVPKRYSIAISLTISKYFMKFIWNKDWKR